MAIRATMLASVGMWVAVAKEEVGRAARPERMDAMVEVGGGERGFDNVFEDFVREEGEWRKKGGIALAA